MSVNFVKLTLLGRVSPLKTPLIAKRYTKVNYGFAMTPEDRILDYYTRKPFYRGATRLFKSSAKNDCGDVIFIDIEFDENDAVYLEWSGSGCAQSIAAAGMMCEHLQGENPDNFTEEDMLNLFGLKDCRRDCVLVAWRALKNASGTTP